MITASGNKYKLRGQNMMGGGILAHQNFTNQNENVFKNYKNFNNLNG